MESYVLATIITIAYLMLDFSEYNPYNRSTTEDINTDRWYILVYVFLLIIFFIISLRYSEVENVIDEFAKVVDVFAIGLVSFLQYFIFKILIK